MKICHLIFSLESGGSENLLIDIANVQVKTNDVSVIIINNMVNFNLLSSFDPEIKIEQAKRRPGNKTNLYFLIKIWQWILKNKPDIIHCHNHELIQLLPFWRHITVLTVHDVGISLKNIPKYKKVFAISEAVQKDLVERGQINCAVVYNGIRIRTIRKKNMYPFDKDKEYKILQVSRLMHQKKGQHIAIEALKKLRGLGFLNVNLFFIGSGPSLEFLKKMSVEMDLQKNVTFLGEKNREWIYENLFQFDLLIQPSFYEGFGLSIIEGIAAGLPVIASRIDGPEEILKDMPSGLLFRAGDADDLVSSISMVIDQTIQNNIKQACDISSQIIDPKYSVINTANEYLRQYAN